MFSYKVAEDIELKILEIKYADELYALLDRNRAYLGKWLPWVKGTDNPEPIKQFISQALLQFAENNGFHCGIFYKGTIAGCIGLHKIDWKNRHTSIGYWLGGEYQGRGIMTRACSSLVDYALRELQLNRVEIRAGVMNDKSRAIPVRLGFIYEGTIRQAEQIEDRYIDHAVYGMLAADWKK